MSQRTFSAPLAALLVAASALTACSGPSEGELVASAQTMIAAKDNKGALIQLKSALQKNPQSAQARLLLGKLLLSGGDATAALVELRKAQELQVPDEEVIPEIARAMLGVREETRLIAQYGDLRLRDPAAAADLKTSVANARAVKGDLDGARQAVDAALSLKPDFVAAQLMLARLLAAEGDLDGSLKTVERIIQREPGNERAALLQGELLWRGKADLPAAERAFERALGAHPNSIAAHVSLISLRIAQKKTAEARTQFEALKKVHPDHPETLLFGAQFAFNDKDYKLARELLDRVFKFAPEDVRALELAGAAEFRLRNFVPAEAFLSRALKNAPGLILSRQLLAQTHLRLGQPEKAIEALRPVIDSPQADGGSLALAGEAWLQMGEATKASNAFAAATRAAPGDPRVRTAAALGQIAQGKGAGAIAELEAVAAEDSGPRADLALISTRLRQRDTAGALKAIDRLERKIPDRPLAYQVRGRVQLINRDIAGATKSFETALAKDPAYLPAVASLAAIDLEAKRPEVARQRFEDLLKVQPRSHQARLALAELAARTGAPQSEVTRLLREATKVNPGEALPHLSLVAHLLNSGDAKAALVAAQEGVAASPSSIDLQDALGRSLLATGDGHQAVTTFKALTSQQPRNVVHLLRLADAQALVKDYEAAERSIGRALELQPAFRPAQRARVALAMSQGHTDQALEQVKRLQAADPKDASAWSMEGEIEASRKQWRAASVAFKGALSRSNHTDHAIKLHTALRQAGDATGAESFAGSWRREHAKDAAFAFYLGDIALGAGDHKRAEALYREVLALQPNNALALNNVAWLMVKQGRPGALPLAQQADSLLPGRAPVLDTLALALAADGQSAKAVEIQRRAIELSPLDHGLRLGLARHLIQAGEKSKARAELEGLEKLGPSFPRQDEVKSLLASL